MPQPADPTLDWCCAAGRLSGPARRVHLAVLAAFTATGQPPPPSELGRLARACGADPGAVLAELEAADLDAYTGLLDRAVRWGPPGDPAPPCQSWAQVRNNRT